MEDARNAVVAKLAAATLMSHAKIIPEEREIIRSPEDATYAQLGSLTVLFVSICQTLRVDPNVIFTKFAAHCHEGGLSIPEYAWSEELDVAFATIQASFDPIIH